MTWSRPGACAEHASHSMSMGFVRSNGSGQKEHPDVPRGTEAIAEHLHHMGDGLDPEPVADGPVPIMDLDGQRQAEGLGGTLRLLYHLLGTGHIPPVRGTLYPITGQDGPASYPF